MGSYSTRMDRVAPSAIMELLKTAGGGGYLNLASGLPDAGLFPHETLREITDDILTRDWRAALQYGAAEGYDPLRELVAERMRRRGVEAGAENVLITQGSQQSLDLVARLFLDAGDPVVIESPTYLAALQTFDSYQARYTPVATDQCGADPEGWSEALRSLGSDRCFQYILPNYQNPTGNTLSEERREIIATVAASSRFPLLEDDAYFDLSYEGGELSPLAARTDHPQAMYAGTFSKTITPGLRVGWVCASRDVIARLAQLKQITDLHSGSLTQRIVYRYCADGHLEPQIERLRVAYRDKRDAMLEALSRTMPPGVSWTRPRGGMFVFVTLPEGCDAQALLAVAMKEKLMFVPGRYFFPSGERPGTRQEEGSGHDLGLEGAGCRQGANTLRLNFVSPAGREIDRGIDLLSELIRDCLQ